MTDTTDLPSQYPFDSPDRENMRAETRIAELLKAYNDATPDDLVQLIYAYITNDIAADRRNTKLAIGFADPPEPPTGSAPILALAYDTQRGMDGGTIYKSEAKKTEKGALRSLLCQAAQASHAHLRNNPSLRQDGSALDRPLDSDRLYLLALPDWETNEKEVRYHGNLGAYLVQTLSKGELQEILDIPTPEGAQAYRYTIMSRAGLQANVIVTKDPDPPAAIRKQNKGVTLRGPYAPTLLEAWRAWKAEYNRIQGAGQYGYEDRDGVLSRKKAVQGASADTPEVIWDKFVVRDFPKNLEVWR